MQIPHHTSLSKHSKTGNDDKDTRFYGVVKHLKPEEITRVILEHMKEDSMEGAGGTVVFIGHVKGKVDGHKVIKLLYEAYEPHASRILNQIAKQYSQSPQIKSIKILHNKGVLKPGDPTILITVTALSRKEAFQTAREILERVKHEPPIFKLEYREDGEYWIIGDGTRIPREKQPKHQDTPQTRSKINPLI